MYVKAASFKPGIPVWKSSVLTIGLISSQSLIFILYLFTIYIPDARFHVTEGLGKPSALHSTLASLPCANALSVGSIIQRGGTKIFQNSYMKINYNQTKQS